MFFVLSRMAMDIISVQASSVAFESAFSTSGRVLPIRRTRLTPASLEMCMCLKDHLDVNERKQDKCHLEIPLDFEEDVFDDDVQRNKAIPLSDEEIALDASSEGTLSPKGPRYDYMVYAIAYSLELMNDNFDLNCFDRDELKKKSLYPSDLREILSLTQGDCSLYHRPVFTGGKGLNASSISCKLSSGGGRMLIKVSTYWLSPKESALGTVFKDLKNNGNTVVEMVPTRCPQLYSSLLAVRSCRHHFPDNNFDERINDETTNLGLETDENLVGGDVENNSKISVYNNIIDATCDTSLKEVTTIVDEEKYLIRKKIMHPH
ncbi:zinc finger BED domain-containing protein RICESLEEPER 3 [Tanacetum coccineum]